MAIDLLWLRPGGVGGTEYFIRNVLDGFRKLPDQFEITLLVSKDNRETFQHYLEDRRISLLEANIESKYIARRIIWQNLFQNRFLRKHGFTRCFEPVYCKPWLNGGIEYICVIHDLQAYHYPAYHPLHEIVYSRLCWRMDVCNANRLLAISNWVRSDIEEKYGREDIQVIYNPIQIKEGELSDFDLLKEKYGIEKYGFFYTVTQMIPHKNISTLIEVMDKILKEGYDLPDRLLVSGVNGSARENLEKSIREKGLEKSVILTGVVSNKERNALYKYCNAFLFPSVFEGFGMPPVEAMLFGTKVITTRCTSIPEITQNKANYVEDPFDAAEWIEKIRTGVNRDQEMDFSVYDPEKIAGQYLEVIFQPIIKQCGGCGRSDEK